MDRVIQNKAMLEILTTADAVIVAKDKEFAEKVSRELGKKLFNMGVNASEARTLFEIAGETIFGDQDDEIFFISLTDDEGDESEEAEDDE